MTRNYSNEPVIVQGKNLSFSFVLFLFFFLFFFQVIKSISSTAHTQQKYSSIHFMKKLTVGSFPYFIFVFFNVLSDNRGRRRIIPRKERI